MFDWILAKDYLHFNCTICIEVDIHGGRFIRDTYGYPHDQSEPNDLNSKKFDCILVISGNQYYYPDIAFFAIS
jgi:hypothetical protein